MQYVLTHSKKSLKKRFRVVTSSHNFEEGTPEYLFIEMLHGKNGLNPKDFVSVQEMQQQGHLTCYETNYDDGLGELP